MTVMNSRHLIPRACMAFIRRSSYRRWSSTASALFFVSSSSSSSSLYGSCASYCGTHPSVFQTRMISSSISSSFTPPEPPASKGTSVFLDIDFSVQGNPSSASFLRNNDEDAVFVVTGANRGIGLQLVKSLMERTKGRIVACCRSPDTSQGLQEYISSLSKRKSDGRIQLVTLDVENQQSVEDAVSKIKERFNRVDLLLNVAGILGDGTTTPGPERTLSKINRSWVEKTLAVNVIGPVMLCKELAPLLKSKTTAKGGRPISVVANLSARVGSISDNDLGGWYSYRLSKAALNQATRTMAHELKRQGTWSVALHPGTTDTDLSKPFQRNVQEGRLFPVEFTVGQLLAVIDSMEERNSGGLYDWSGKALPF